MLREQEVDARIRHMWMREWEVNLTTNQGFALISNFQVRQWSGICHVPPRKEHTNVLCTSCH